MTEKLLEAKLELAPSGDVILKQLIQTNERKPRWLNTNISAYERIPDPADEDSMNSEDAFLSGVALSQGVQSTELRHQLRMGETIYIYQRPVISGR